MARTDIHRPSVINPADYDFVAYDYYGPGNDDLGLAAERMAFRAHRERTGGTFSGHEHGGSCHVCGANALYVAKFHHAASNTYIVTGEDCAEKMHMGDARRFRAFRTKVREGLEAIAGKNKAKAVLERAGHGKAWDLYTAENRDGWKYEEATINDIVCKLVRYGSISGKAMNYLGVLLDKLAKRDEVEAAREAARAAERATAVDVPVTSGRVTVSGEVLTLKGVETAFGYVTKMLVKTDAGYKLWGSKPSGLEVAKGDKVEFMARIERSKDDSKFGFWSRATKAKVTEAASAASTESTS